MKKALQFLVPLSLLAVSSATWACGSCCTGGGSVPDPNCIVTWDFTDNVTRVNGDVDSSGNPILTYTGNVSGSSTATYTLNISGFTVGRAKANNGNTLSYSGEIGDGATTYAVDGENTFGIGVHAPGEDGNISGNPDHWGTKIDNVRNTYGDDNELRFVRDAVLLDFENCVVSLDKVGLERIKDWDFEVWAYTGDAIDYSTSLVSQLEVDYDNWGTAGSDMVFVEEDWSGSTAGYRTADITNAIKSQYFVLIAGGNKYDGTSGSPQGGDAFRMTGLQVTCDPGECTPDTGGGPGVPVPGTLALLGLGALLGRKRFLKLAA